MSIWSDKWSALQVKEEQPELKFTEIAGVLGKKWKALEDKDKKPYEEQAAKDKARYEKENAAYKAKGETATADDDEDEE